MSIGEIGRQRLSRRLVGAGGIPAPAIAPCERIDALVDHGVVPISLACDVTVNDGGGIDLLLSAKRVGPSGHTYGLDMTDEMRQKASKRHTSDKYTTKPRSTSVIRTHARRCTATRL
jgi:hypothetical protein